MNYFSVMNSEKAKALNTLTLAFIGDAVHTLYEREECVHQSDAKAGILHLRVTEKVKAAAQAGLADALQTVFTEEELEIYHRGRNCKSHTVAKHASVEDYRKATGLEAVLGYLYLTGTRQRIVQLLQLQEKAQ